MKKIIVIGVILVAAGAILFLAADRRTEKAPLPAEEINAELAGLAVSNRVNLHELPSVYSIIDIEKMPEELAYQQEAHQIKFFASRATADDPPVMLVAVDDYRGEVGVTPEECAGHFLSLRTGHSRPDEEHMEDAGEKWLKGAEGKTINEAAAWADDRRLLMQKDGTIVRAELLDPNYSREFDALTMSVRIK